jgi:hypothetical protein
LIAVRTVLSIVAVLAILMGLLWIGQGLGLIMWPASSFMLAQRQWAINGAVLAAAGSLVLWFARRRT